MNCRQPVRAENELTSQKCNDRIQLSISAVTEVRNIEQSLQIQNISKFRAENDVRKNFWLYTNDI